MKQAKILKRVKSKSKSSALENVLNIQSTYSSIKKNKHEKKASEMTNKYLEKIAIFHKHEKKAQIEGTILGPKARAKKVLDALEAHEKLKRNRLLRRIGTVGLMGAAGIGGYYAGKTLLNKGQEKRANVFGKALGAARGFGQKVMRGTSMLPKQLGNVQAAAAKRGIFSKQTAGALKPLLRNKAVQTGAGLVGAGLVGGAMLNKQSSENKYLAKIAGMFGGFGQSLPKPPMPALPRPTIGVRG